MSHTNDRKVSSTEAIPPEDLAGLRELEDKIGHRYRDVSLLRNALVHKSYANECGGEAPQDNERLEFVGDAVLQFVVSEHLYNGNPEQSEGPLTVMRSSIVARKHCAVMAKELELGNHVLVGKGERGDTGEVQESILANAFEALVASLYFDGGMKAAKRFVLKMLERCEPPGMDEDENFKAQLQAISQKEDGVLPFYRLISSEGPEHEKTFTVEVSIRGVPYGWGKGASKKEAEQHAAEEALRKMADEGVE
jgi:ribonuclease-3